MSGYTNGKADYDNDIKDISSYFLKHRLLMQNGENIDHEKIKTIAMADKALHISQNISTEEQGKDVLLLSICFSTMNQARSIAHQAFTKNKKQEDVEIRAKYTKEMFNAFNMMLDELPLEMQLLKVIYNSQSYDEVAKFMFEYCQCMYNNDETRYVKLLEEMRESALKHSRDRAIRYMHDRIPKFSNLPKDTQEQLIAQHSYITQLRNYASYASKNGNNEVENRVRELTASIERNIKNVATQQKTIEDAVNDFQKIQEEIAGKEQSLAYNIFYDRAKSNLTTAVEFVSANTLISSFLLPYTPNSISNSALTTVLSSIAKATLPTFMSGALKHIDTLKFASNIYAGADPLFATAAGTASVLAAGYDALSSSYTGQEIEESKKLSAEVIPADYEYISGLDKLWGVHTAKPLDEIKITGTSLQDKIYSKVSDMAENAKDQGIQYVSSKVLTTTNKAIISTIMLVLLSSVVFSMVTLTILFPAILPVWIGLGAGLIGAGVFWKYKNPLQILSDTVLRTCTKAMSNTYTIFYATANSIRNLFGNLMRGNFTSTIKSAVSSIGLGALSIMLVPILVPLSLAFAMTGVVVGAIQRKNPFTIIKGIFYEPYLNVKDLYKEVQRSVNVELKMDAAISASTDNNLKADDTKALTIKLLTHLQNRVHALQDKLKRIPLVAEQNIEIKLLVSEVKELEDAWRAANEHISNHDYKGFFQIMDDYLKAVYEAERAEFINLAKNNKQQNVEPVQNKPAYTERIRKKLMHKFSKKPTSIDSVLGAEPDFETQYNARDYEKERTQLAELAQLKVCVRSTLKALG